MMAAAVKTSHSTLLWVKCFVIIPCQTHYNEINNEIFSAAGLGRLQTSNIKISHHHVADCVIRCMQHNNCFSSTSTNQILDLWHCPCHCRHCFLNSLILYHNYDCYTL